MVVTTSCLDNALKKELKTQVVAMGGHVISEWRKECSLLVMASISVTVKVRSYEKLRNILYPITLLSYSCKLSIIGIREKV